MTLPLLDTRASTLSGSTYLGVAKRHKTAMTRFGIFVLCMSFVLVFGMSHRYADTEKVSKTLQRLNPWRTDPKGVVTKVTGKKVCNPYDYHGVLKVDPEPQDNVFTPTLAPKDCQVQNLMLELIRNSSNIDFIRDKTVIMFGDSVDRNLHSDICGLSGGRRIMIGSDSSLAPPYPKGQERPPKGYVNKFDGDNTRWPDFTESRPWMCYYKHFNFRLINVFHYGFRPATTYIEMHPHFYPPALIEDRFDDIVVPIMKNVAREHGVSEVPDIVTFTSGFWSLMRTKYELVNGTSLEEGGQLQPMVSDWDPENVALKDWFVARIQMTIKHVAKGWSYLPASNRPLIMWRTLHHVKGNGQVTMGHVQALDQMGRAVANRLIEEGASAAGTNGEWEAWSMRARQIEGWMGHSRSEARDMDLGNRLVISRWSDIILGTETHSRDDIHPDVLPAGQLYGNMLLQQLKILDAERS